MKKVKHVLYPVSYIGDDGKRCDSLWLCEAVGAKFHTGAPIEIEAYHPEVLGDEYRAAAIADLEQRLAQLKGGAA